jgi:hypothetical protein
VFWKHSRREERRQDVLDELMGLDPSDRRERLDRAVAAGDVQVGEVESTLRLVDRLDALRVFTIRPYGEESGGAAAEEKASGEEIGAAALDEWTPVEPPQTATATATATRRAKSPAGQPADAGPVQERRWLTAASMPMDAIESASRLVARDRAARKARAAALSSRQRRVRTTLAEHRGSPELSAPVALPVVVQLAAVPMMAEQAAEPSHDENWPSIAWLRP